MQEAAFNTPGAEAPVTPSIVMGGIGLLFGHFVVGRRLLRLRGWQALFELGGRRGRRRGHVCLADGPADLTVPAAKTNRHDGPAR
ncbi:MAG: hypothetical protein R3A10_00925 [Caldilineaceae bacterium]